LENKKQEFDLFSNLEQQAINISQLYGKPETLELASQSPLTQLAAEKPSLKGFLQKIIF